MSGLINTFNIPTINDQTITNYGGYLFASTGEKNMFEAKAVPTIGGFRAHVVYKGVVLWESPRVWKKELKAVDAARAVIVSRLEDVFN